MLSGTAMVLAILNQLTVIILNRDICAVVPSTFDTIMVLTLKTLPMQMGLSGVESCAKCRRSSLRCDGRNVRKVRCRHVSLQIP